MEFLSNRLPITSKTLLFLCVWIILESPLKIEAAPISNCELWVAKVVSIEGRVEVRSDAEKQWRPLIVEELLCGGEMVQVSAKSRAAIFLREQKTTIRLDQHTVMTLAKIEADEPGWLEIMKGIANFFSRTPMSFKVKTPFMNAGIEGTEFSVNVNAETTEITVMEGRVVAENAKGSISLRNNEKAIAGANQPPSKILIANSRNTVWWALYYPPIIDYDSEIMQNTVQGSSRVKAIRLYESGKIVAAIEALKIIPSGKRNIDDYNLEAGLLLSVGRVELARLSIAEVLQMDSDNATARGLESIIALVNNDREQALQIAKKAVMADSASSVARIALSYALQANFKIDLALFNLQESAIISPGNALLQARIAELELARGKPNQAMSAARRAVALNPDLSYPNTVLGFNYLIAVELASAISAFQQAIILDSSDPLPRLGLGLAKIRRGDLADGTLDIEIAAGLSPNNPLIRTYLGKSYYDQKKAKRAANEYEIAKILDPKDPSAWFYHAIQKQTENRPIEALGDLQEAIKLNDNRLIYRSKQLVESDLAARNAALGRVFFNLGFRQRALVEGWNSIGNDFQDYSGHRFLADSYTSLPRHEVAQASELLQSQLLQPINSSPVSPLSSAIFSIQSQVDGSASESNRSLLLIDSNGPTKASFNEFRPLFNRDKISLFSSVVMGNQDTLGDEVVISGINNNLSFSLGQSHFQSSGFRNNSDTQNDVYNVYLQNRLTASTRIVAEYRYLQAEQGDLRQRFDGDFVNDLRTNIEAHIARLGFHHAWSPGHALSGSFAYVDSDSSLNRTIAQRPFFNNIQNQDYILEFQNSFRGNGYGITAGIGYYNREQNRKTVGTVGGEALSSQKEKNINGYLYSQIDLSKTVDLTVGLSADMLDIEKARSNKRIHLNPKIGITWNPTYDTTVRVAGYRASKRKLPTNQTLEPTQIAGFNQFFDDVEDAVSWRYGLGVDQRFSSSLFAGAEFSVRNLDNPKSPSWSESVARSYFYWAPHPWWSFSTDYFYEYLNQRNNNEGFNLLKTHRVQMGFSFNHPSGLSARLSPSFVYQQGDFIRSGIFEARPDDDQFVVLGMMASYRLPKRYGFVSIRVENLFNQQYNFQETDLRRPLFEKERRIIGGLTLNF